MEPDPADCRGVRDRFRHPANRCSGQCDRAGCRLFSSRIGRMLRRMSASLSRIRLGAVLGINQTLSWGMTFYLPAVIAGPAAGDLGESTFALVGAFTLAL